jgi:rhodanese-related sulfurtransferase
MRCLYTLLAFIIVSSAAIARGDVSTTEAAQMMKKSSTIVVDVRTPAEYAEGHLYKSRLIDYLKHFVLREGLESFSLSELGYLLIFYT